MKMAHNFSVALAVVAMTVAVTSCTLDNGLPADLRHHLATRGIELQELDSIAPLSGRSGLIIARKNEGTLEQLSEVFAMRRVADGRERSHCLRTISVTVQDVWALTGRPASLKLGNGAQFEYMCVVTTPDDKMYIIAEYAYG